MGTEAAMAIICVVLSVSVLIGAGRKKNENLLMAHMCLCIFLTLTSDIAFEALKHSLEYITLIRLLLVVNYAGVNGTLVFFTFYMMNVLRRKAYVSSDLGYAVVFFACLMTILWTVDIYESTGWFVIMNETEGFRNGSGWWICTVSTIMFLILNVVLAASCSREFSLGEVLSWITYPVFPMTAFPFITDFGVGIMYSAFALSVLFVYIFDHVRRQKQLAETEAMLEASKNKLMLSQIQPHFMYNSLNSIYYLIEKDPAEAQEAVNTFSDYLRRNINSLKSDSPVNFRTEFFHTMAYLNLEKIRFGKRLTVESDIRADKFKLPPLSLQPLAENAVKHGLEPKENGGIVKISTAETEDYYIITIEDDGAGLSDKYDESHTHIGIDNVRSRLRNICGGSLEIKNREGCGAVSVIVLPKEAQKNL